MIRASDSGGTCVEIHLPILHAAPLDHDDPESVAARPVKPATILIIDPDPEVRSQLTEALQSMGHEVIAFPDAGRGQGFLQLTWHADHLILADDLPDNQARKNLLDWIAENRPEIRTVLLGQDSARDHPGNRHWPRHWTTRIPKPFSSRDLMARFGHVGVE